MIKPAERWKRRWINWKKKKKERRRRGPCEKLQSARGTIIWGGHNFRQTLIFDGGVVECNQMRPKHQSAQSRARSSCDSASQSSKEKKKRRARSRDVIQGSWSFTKTVTRISHQRKSKNPTEFIDLRVFCAVSAVSILNLSTLMNSGRWILKLWSYERERERDVHPLRSTG